MKQRCGAAAVPAWLVASPVVIAAPVRSDTLAAAPEFSDEDIAHPAWDRRNGVVLVRQKHNGIALLKICPSPGTIHRRHKFPPTILALM